MKRITVFLFFLTVSHSFLHAQVDDNETFIDSLATEIVNVRQELFPLKENYYVIAPFGIAGNIGVFISDDGIILVDDQWSVLANRIKELLSGITQKPVKMIINSHYHFDHTNGNIAFGEEKVPIISHVNARKRMKKRQVIPTFFIISYKNLIPVMLCLH